MFECPDLDLRRISGTLCLFAAYFIFVRWWRLFVRWVGRHRVEILYINVDRRRLFVISDIGKRRWIWNDILFAGGVSTFKFKRAEPFKEWSAWFFILLQQGGIFIFAAFKSSDVCVHFITITTLLF